jgi:subtilisin family serine protease
MKKNLLHIAFIALASLIFNVNGDNVNLHVSPKEKTYHSPLKKENKFIVTLHPDYTHDHFEAFFSGSHISAHASLKPMTVHHKYTHVLHGLAVSNIDEETLRTYPGVLRIAKDTLKYRRAVTWGQDRIDQPSLPLDNKYKPDYKGVGVDVYIVDSRKQCSYTLTIL